MSSVIFLWGKQAHKGRCGRQRSWLKPPDCDCWVDGERFGFSRCEASGADETEQKHLLITFAAATLKKEFQREFLRG